MRILHSAEEPSEDAEPVEAMAVTVLEARWLALFGGALPEAWR